MSFSTGQISKEDIKVSVMFHEACACHVDMLRFHFGFRRVSKEELFVECFSKRENPNQAEVRLSHIPEWEFHKNIEDWCKENNILFKFDYQTQTYLFSQV